MDLDQSMVQPNREFFQREALVREPIVGVAVGLAQVRANRQPGAAEIGVALPKVPRPSPDVAERFAMQLAQKVVITRCGKAFQVA